MPSKKPTKKRGLTKSVKSQARRPGSTKKKATTRKRRAYKEPGPLEIGQGFKSREKTTPPPRAIDSEGRRTDSGGTEDGSPNEAYGA